jgi:hypothetical protein
MTPTIITVTLASIIAATLRFAFKVVATAVTGHTFIVVPVARTARPSASLAHLVVVIAIAAGIISPATARITSITHFDLMFWKV